MTLRYWFAALLLGTAALATVPALAEDVAPSARVSSAVLVRAGPSTDTSVLARLRPGDSATLVDDDPGPSTASHPPPRFTIDCTESRIVGLKLPFEMGTSVQL